MASAPGAGSYVSSFAPIPHPIVSVADAGYGCVTTSVTKHPANVKRCTKRKERVRQLLEHRRALGLIRKARLCRAATTERRNYGGWRA